jgi:hypothetical protein
MLGVDPADLVIGFGSSYLMAPYGLMWKMISLLGGESLVDLVYLLYCSSGL